MALTDEVIRRMVIEQLQWDGRLSNSEIEVRVKGGQVILEGKVSSFSARQAAEADVLLVPEVVKVVDKTSIVYQGGAQGVTDDEIRSSLLNRFLWNPNINASELEVSSENGNVTLTGTVDGYWKKLRAEEIAYDVRGVVHVHNELAVVPSHEYGDREIADNITGALRRGGRVDVEHLELQVENGTVTVGGALSSRDEEYEILHALHYTRGVRDVVNLMTVRRKAA